MWNIAIYCGHAIQCIAKMIFYFFLPPTTGTLCLVFLLLQPTLLVWFPFLEAVLLLPSTCSSLPSLSP